MKVFIVFRGTYSDRETRAVFDNEQAANNHIENNCDRDKFGSRKTWDDWDIEEWELNGECILKNRSMWRVDMAKNGTTLYVGREPNGAEKSEEFAKEWNCETSNYDPGFKLISIVEAENEKHAVKIANEKRIQLIAEEKWGE